MIDQMNRSVAILVFALLLPLHSGAQELFTDFPTASLESWSVNNGTINLVGEPTWSAFPNSYRWVHFRAEGLLDTQPEFQIGSFSNSFFGDLTGHRFVWSHDQTNWSFFDNNFGNSNNFRFSNDTPFLEDDVFVAYSTPYPVQRTTEHVESLASEWFVTPTASAKPNLVVGEIEDLPLYGFRITNPLVTEQKAKVVLLGGNHSGEHGANFALEGMLDFLTSDDPRAMQMRNVAEFFVYPQVDPLGRDEGYYRGNSQNAANDHNRFWDANVTGDNGGFAEIDLVTGVLRNDTGGNVDYALDFHGFFNSGDDFIFTDTPGNNSEFIEELLTLVPSLGVELDDSTEPAGIFEIWARTEEGLNATLSFTPEFSPNALASESIAVGESYGLALFAELGSPGFVRDTREVDTLTRALLDGSQDLDLDLNRDGSLNDEDLNFLLDEILDTTLGDTDLNGRVDFSDFLSLSNGFGGSGAWGDGDFDGNQRIEFADFLVLSRNFGTTAVQPVPEPSSHWLLTGFITIKFLIRKRIRPRRTTDLMQE